MKRIAIIGSGGAGKSTLARAVGRTLGLPVIHLDAVFWQPGWVEPDKALFDQELQRLTTQDAWVMDGNYSRTMDLRLAAADTIVYLDFPRLLCLFRIVKRQFQYAGRTRPDMTPGCPERLSLEFVRWVWNYPRDKRPGVLKKLQQCREQGKTVVRLRGPREVRDFLTALPSAQPDAIPRI